MNQLKIHRVIARLSLIQNMVFQIMAKRCRNMDWRIKLPKYILKYIFRKREGMETKKAGFTGFDEGRCTLVFKISYTGLA
ncbi:hypothetical protein [uncultured Dialister sp.]|uniref:hypothetical protein n=1 Tax=uncultured Dialister sp. TaxID=278064 RepID=UPI002676C338|nr:hypothetical protein [uncultured Dialister sp.]